MKPPSTFLMHTICVLFVVLMTNGSCWAQKELLVVVGAAGEEEFGKQFEEWSQAFESLKDESINLTMLNGAAEKTDRMLLQEQLQTIANDEQTEELWLVLLGHGTFDGNTAKFNLKGPDFSSIELKEWLNFVKQKTVIINCSSCSSPFVKHLSGPNRIVISATKSESQYNFARFGQFFSDAMQSNGIDLDKDGQTSLLEAFVAASTKTQDFYASDGRLATELALLDDNGDGYGTPANWFSGTRAVKKPKTGKADGLAANQTFLTRNKTGLQLSPEAEARRNELELELQRLFELKRRIGEDDYYNRLEAIMVELAKLYTN